MQAAINVNQSEPLDLQETAIRWETWESLPHSLVDLIRDLERSLTKNEQDLANLVKAVAKFKTDFDLVIHLPALPASWRSETLKHMIHLRTMADSISAIKPSDFETLPVRKRRQAVEDFNRLIANLSGACDWIIYQVLKSWYERH